MNKALELASECNEPHVHQEGARFHVLSWIGFEPRFPAAGGRSVTVCSEPLCEFNGRAIRAIESEGRSAEALLPEIFRRAARMKVHHHDEA